MKRNVKAEITNLIDERMSEIQKNFVDNKLTDEGREIITVLTNQALNLVRRHELDYRDLDSECFSYDKNGKPMFSEDKITELVSTTIYLKLVEVSKKEKTDFLGISKNDSDSLYNFKRKECSKFVRYVDDFREEEGLVPLEITPDELYTVCTKKSVNFEALFLWYIDRCDANLLNVIKILFTDLFKRINKENQQFLIDWTKQELHKRAITNIQHTRIDEFISQRVRYTDCDRSLQMLLSKIIENDIKK